MIKNFTRTLFTLFLSGIFVAFTPVRSWAQQTNVVIRIVDKNGHPAPFASIKVAPENDSIPLYQKVADTLGKASFNLSTNHRYAIFISSVNHLSLERVIAITNRQGSFTFVLEDATATLDMIVIHPAKPIMRQDDDKTIVDPENLAASSSSGYEVIEKVPGIFMDQDGNIYLNSTTPASVYINGREQKMSTADVASLLKSLPPNSISKIEILRTPSAKYDASGSGGIVNVVLKKGIKMG